MVRKRNGSPQTPLDNTALIAALEDLRVTQEELRTQNEDLSRATREIEEIHDRYAQLFELGPIGYVTLDSSGLVNQANLAAIEMLAPGRSIIDLPFWLLVAEEFRDQFASHFRRVLAGHPAADEMSLRCGDGSLVPVSLKSVPVLSGRMGRTRCLTGVFDISGWKLAEQRLKEAQAQSEAADRIKTQFLSQMSHELRAPLNAIMGFVDCMRLEMFGPIDNPKYTEFLQDIYRSGAHLIELIGDILDISKIEAGKMELAEQWIDPVPLVSQAVRSVAILAQDAKLDLVCRLPQKVPRLLVDERRLAQVLLNLLSNAIKFTPPGGSVTVSGFDNSDGAFALQISDTGIGIDPSQIERALTPFEQVRSEVARNSQGTGLGLSLSKTLMELHGGSLTLRSAPQKGTSVTISLPAWRTEHVYCVPDTVGGRGA